MRRLFPENTFVAPRIGTNFRLMIGEAPGATEAEIGEPFAGTAGGWLRNIYSKAGLNEAENSACNVLQCRPPDNIFPTDPHASSYISQKEAYEAVSHCSRNHVRPFLDSRPWERIDIFGDKPLRFVLERSSGIGKWRGSILGVPALDNRRIAVPTFHPAYIARDQSMFPVAINDIRKTLEIEPESYNIYPSLDDVRAFKAKKFAFDIETSGWTKEISMIGFSAEDYKAIVVPFSGEYIAEIKRIFIEAEEVIGQNLVQFDLPVLAYNDVHVRGPKECMVWDIMLLHHLRFPTFPHDLEFIGKQFTNKGAWKYDKVSFETYCARDVDVTWRSFAPLKWLAEQAGLIDLYKYVSWPMGRICHLMTEIGLQRSSSRIKTLREELLQKIVDAEKLLPIELQTYYVRKRKRINTPPGYLNKNGKPARYAFEEYDKAITPWRSSETKKHYLYDTLGLPEQRNIKTKQVTADKNALDKLYNRTKLPALRALKELNKWATLLSGFAKDEEIANDVVHPSFNVHGTETGRLCIAPDTLIEMPRDLLKFPDGIPLRDVKVGDLVYSLTWDKRLTLKPVTWIGPTGYKPTCKITVVSRWGKETSFRVTESHLVRMFAGDWRPAGSLKIGQRLCGMPRRGIGEYASFFPSATRRKQGESGGRAKEHRWILSQILGLDNLPSKWDVHHIDENKLNNSPVNLMKVMHGEHQRMHKRVRTPEQISDLLKCLDTLTYAQRKAVKRSAKLMGILPATNHTITAIENCAAEEVWDLEVKDTHTLFGGDVALHNSSSSPNIQNQPPTVRFTYVPRTHGGKYISVDFSGIENRLVAFLAKDRKRMEWFKDANFSEHKWLVSLREKIPYDSVEKSKEKDSSYAIGKIIVHGSDRMMGAKKISEQFDVDFNTAKDFQALWKREIADTVAWQQRVSNSGARTGWTANPFGRKLWTWETNAATRIVSFLPQSTAFDVIARAMIACMYERIDWPIEWAQKVAPVTEPLPDGVLLLAQVHDELLTETESAELVDPTLNVLRKVMTQPWPELNGLSLPIGTAVGDSWGDCE